jgi:hypothetical protein
MQDAVHLHPRGTVNEGESKPTKVEDLEKPLTDKTAEQVKGGMSGGGTNTPILIKPVNPRGIVPCI